MFNFFVHIVPELSTVESKDFQGKKSLKVTSESAVINDLRAEKLHATFQSGQIKFLAAQSLSEKLY